MEKDCWLEPFGGARMVGSPIKLIRALTNPPSGLIVQRFFDMGA